METAIETRGLTKVFERSAGWRRSKGPPVTAVSEVSLRVETGEIFGLLGPNGAGKTTLVKMLSTLILPTRGQAMVAGYSLDEGSAIRAAVGLAITDERSFYWRLTGEQNLEFYAALVGLYGRAARDRIAQVLTQVELENAAGTRFSNYSSGMKQRLAIARSLLHRPRILFLDEPSRSLDPIATGRLHHLIRQLMVREALTLFLITHDLSEAESLCGRVALMHLGRIQLVGEPAELRRQLPDPVRRQYFITADQLTAEVAAQLAAATPGLTHDLKGDLSMLRFAGTEEDGVLSAVLTTLHRAGVTIHAIEGNPPGLGEVVAQFAAGGLSRSAVGQKDEGYGA